MDEYIIETFIGIIGIMTSVGGYLLINWIKNRNKDKVVESVEQDEAVYDILEAIRDEFNADRVCIMQIHNGTRYYNGGHMQKMSCSHEVTSDDFSHIQAELQNMLISGVPRYIRNVIKHDCYYHNSKDDHHTFLFKAYAKEYDIKSFCAAPIYQNNHLVAIINLHWCKDLDHKMEKEYDDFIDRVQELKNYL